MDQFEVPQQSEVRIGFEPRVADKLVEYCQEIDQELATVSPDAVRETPRLEFSKATKTNSPAFESVSAGIKVSGWDRYRTVVKGEEVKPSFKLEGSSYLHIRQLDDEHNNGFLDDARREQLKTHLASTGITLVDGPYREAIEYNGYRFDLSLGPRNLQEAEQHWEQYQKDYRAKPTGNEFVSLSFNTPLDGASPKEQIEAQTKAYAKVLGEFTRGVEKTLTGTTTGVELTIPTYETRKKQVQLARGYEISNIGEGIFDHQGHRRDFADGIYSVLDKHELQKTDDIFEHRVLGDGQLLTVHPGKESLLFGRWGGQAASDERRQADVLIAHDVNPETHTAVNELSVSRRSFSVLMDEEFDTKIAEITEGEVHDAVRITDHNSIHGVDIFRAPQNERFFSDGDRMKSLHGDSEIILPGDMFTTGGSSGPGENVLQRIIVMRYLGKDEAGNRQFVKTTIRTQDVPTIDVVEQLELMRNPEMYDRIQAAKPELEQAQAEGRFKVEEVPHFNPQDRLNAEQIEQALPERLLELTLQRANSYKEQTVRDANLLAIIEHSPDSAAVSLAVSEAVAEASPATVVKLTEMLHSSDIWAKIDQQLVLPLLMQVSRNRTFTPEQAYRFGTRAFMAHSDGMRPPVKEAMRILVDTLKAEAGVDF